MTRWRWKLRWFSFKCPRCGVTFTSDTQRPDEEEHLKYCRGERWQPDPVQPTLFDVKQ